MVMTISVGLGRGGKGINGRLHMGDIWDCVCCCNDTKKNVVWTLLLRLSPWILYRVQRISPHVHLNPPPRTPHVRFFFRLLPMVVRSVWYAICWGGCGSYFPVPKGERLGYPTNVRWGGFHFILFRADKTKLTLWMRCVTVGYRQSKSVWSSDVIACPRGYLYRFSFQLTTIGRGGSVWSNERLFQSQKTSKKETERRRRTSLFFWRTWQINWEGGTQWILVHFSSISHS